MTKLGGIAVDPFSTDLTKIAGELIEVLKKNAPEVPAVWNLMPHLNEAYRLGSASRDRYVKGLEETEKHLREVIGERDITISRLQVNANNMEEHANKLEAQLGRTEAEYKRFAESKRSASISAEGLIVNHVGELSLHVHYHK